MDKTEIRLLDLKVQRFLRKFTKIINDTSVFSGYNYDPNTQMFIIWHTDSNQGSRYHYYQLIYNLINDYFPGDKLNHIKFYFDEDKKNKQDQLFSKLKLYKELSETDESIEKNQIIENLAEEIRMLMMDLSTYS